MSFPSRSVEGSQRLGAEYLGAATTRFLVWAPFPQRVQLRLFLPEERLIPMKAVGDGYYQAILEGVTTGTRYKFHLEGGDFPDPASRSQPLGVHGPSEVVENDFAWTDQNWAAPPLKDLLIYELHVGTYTAPGTFDAIIETLHQLKETGITAIQLMPVAEFPGARNWGYDGVYPYAPHSAYGGVKGLKRLVNAAHDHGLAVILDVVYNHLGPEGNYLWQYGPYFTEEYQTPWGPAVNFDGEDSRPVRRYFIENAVHWIRDYHFDGLRLDAVHAIFDSSTPHILEELTGAVHDMADELGRPAYVIAESDLNDNRLVRFPSDGGYGLDAQWNDDFHHSLHALLTKEASGYYADFGGLDHLERAIDEGFVYAGQYSGYRGRCHGTSSADLAADRFIVFSQNHDQIGNRMLGTRLANMVSFESAKLAAGVVLLSPFIPLLFMGQEYAETAPFLYFVSHTDPDLVRAVREGRKEEFAAFAWLGELPDPQAEESFHQSKLNPSLRNTGSHRVMLDFYRNLIELRKSTRALAVLDKNSLELSRFDDSLSLAMRRWAQQDQALVVFGFSESEQTIEVALPPGTWSKALDSARVEWLGPGSAAPEHLESNGAATLRLRGESFVVYRLTAPG